MSKKKRKNNNVAEEKSACEKRNRTPIPKSKSQSPLSDLGCNRGCGSSRFGLLPVSDRF